MLRIACVFLAAAALTAGCSHTSAAPQTSLNSDPTFQMPLVPSPLESSAAMEGTGIQVMGGKDGKEWGSWESTGLQACSWSIDSAPRNQNEAVLASGKVPDGAPVGILIAPDGIAEPNSGMVGDDHLGHRIVFHSAGCGTWSLVVPLIAPSTTASQAPDDSLGGP